MDEFMCPVKSIKIGAFDMSIKYMEWDEYNEGDAEGNFSSFTCSIKISKNQNRRQTADTILHELIHAIEYVMAAATKRGDSECYVDSMASGWGMVIRDNPEFIKWILFLLGD